MFLDRTVARDAARARLTLDDAPGATRHRAVGTACIAAVLGERDADRPADARRAIERRHAREAAG
jgi:hypothetical protein